jgi:hypothetical protein
MVQEQPPSQSKLSETFSWMVAVTKLLTILEKFLPAFLVAYSNNLRNKNSLLEGKLEISEIEKRIYTHDMPKEKPSSIINRFLKSRSDKRGRKDS